LEEWLANDEQLRSENWERVEASVLQLLDPWALDGVRKLAERLHWEEGPQKGNGFCGRLSSV
jgi:hypothetical protein